MTDRNRQVRSVLTLIAVACIGMMTSAAHAVTIGTPNVPGDGIWNFIVTSTSAPSVRQPFSAYGDALAFSFRLDGVVTSHDFRNLVEGPFAGSSYYEITEIAHSGYFEYRGIDGNGGRIDGFLINLRPAVAVPEPSALILFGLGVLHWLPRACRSRVRSVFDRCGFTPCHVAGPTNQPHRTHNQYSLAGMIQERRRNDETAEIGEHDARLLVDFHASHSTAGDRFPATVFRRWYHTLPSIVLAALCWWALASACCGAIAFGTAGATITGTTSLAVDYPASIASGDLLLICISNKGPSTPAVSPTTPTGFAQVGNFQSSSSSTGTPADDTGATRSTVFYKVADGTESGSITVTITGADSSLGKMLRYTKSESTWLLGWGLGADTGAAATWTTSGTVNPGVRGGDVVVVCSAIATDLYTFSAQALATTGVTYGTATEREETASATGFDAALVISDHAVTSGVATAVPTFTMTSSGTTSAAIPGGASVMVRLREYTSTAVVKVSAADGNLSAGGTWVGGVAPAAGDCIDVAAGHDINVDVSIVLGNSPPESEGSRKSGYGTFRGNTDAAWTNVVTPAIKATSTSTLTIKNGVTLTQKGDCDILSGAYQVTMEPGSKWLIDSSDSADPANTQYVVNQCHLILQGTSWADANDCEINGNDGGSAANARWLSVTADSSSVNGTFWKFKNFGDGTDADPVASIVFDPPSTKHMVCTDFRVESCGNVIFASVVAANNFDLDRFTFTGSLGAESILSISGVASPTGTRRMRGFVLDKGVKYFNAVHGLAISNGYGLSFWGRQTASTGATTSNLFGHYTVADPGFGLPGASVADSYFYTEVTSNPHFITIDSTIDSDASMTGCIFEQGVNNTGDLGDCIMASSNAGNTLTISGNIVLPNPNGVASAGTLFSLLGNASSTISATHNTSHHVGGAVGETYTGHAGMVSAFKSNLIWRASASSNYKLYDSGTNDSVSDLVTSANADYNTGYLVTAGSNLKGYNNLEFSSGSPGANDIDVDPQFVDPTRNLATWDASLGGPGTAANAITQMKKLNDSDFTAGYTVANLVAYVRAGFVPTNELLRNAGHDAVTIGAVEMGAASNSIVPILLQLSQTIEKQPYFDTYYALAP